MRLRLAVTVHGKAVPQGSKKGFLRGKHVVVVDQAAERLEPWREQVANVARRNFKGDLIEGPVKVSFVIVKVRGSTHLTSKGLLSSTGAELKRRLAPATSPDLGKLERAIEDALSGEVYRDDAQIVWRDSRKVWGTVERVLIYVWELDASDDVDLRVLYLPIEWEERRKANPLTPTEAREMAAAE